MPCQGSDETAPQILSTFECNYDTFLQNKMPLYRTVLTEVNQQSVCAACACLLSYRVLATRITEYDHLPCFVTSTPAKNPGPEQLQSQIYFTHANFTLTTSSAESA